MRDHPENLTRRPATWADEDSPASPVDVLSDVLSTLGLTTRVFCRSELTVPWAMSLPASSFAHFHVVERGACWLRLGEGDDPLALSAGDLVVIPQGRGHLLADSPERPGVPLQRLLEKRASSGGCAVIQHGGGGPRTTLICGSFQVARPGGHPLMQLLPEVLLLRGEDGRAPEWLESTLRFLAAESRSGRPGGAMVMARLTDILFIQALRAWREQHPGERGSWLAALGDPRIGSALAAIHERPHHAWTVAALASRAGMSRSPFAASFAKLVGEPPLSYVFRWRMQRAAGLLRDRSLSLAEVAERVGYDSEAAFHRAFKRATGDAPGAWRRREAARGAS